MFKFLIAVGLTLLSLSSTMAQDQSRDSSYEREQIEAAVAAYDCDSPAQDLTGLFFKKNSPTDEILIKELRKFHFLFVTGITYHAPDNKKDFFEDYFGELTSWMTPNKISWEKIKTKANHPPRENVSIIEAAFETARITNKPIIVITHSKGALDIAHYLTHLQTNVLADARPPIAGWIPIQPPFWGSYSSTKTLKKWHTRVVATLDEFFQGASPQFAQMLSTPQAIDTYVTDVKNKIMFERVVNDETLKILNVKAWVEDINHFLPSMTKKHKKLRAIKLAPNPAIIPTDGFSEFRSQNIPCVDYVTLKNVDHWDLSWPSYRDNAGEVLKIYKNIFKVWLSLP